MRVTMIRDDNMVIIDGRALSVDLSDIPADVHAVQWFGESGHVEKPGQPNESIGTISGYQTWINRFNDAAYEIDNPPPYVPTQAETIQAFKDAIQQTLDDAAQAKNYDDIVSACSYAGYPNVFQAEAIAFGQWRANVWAYGYAELDKVIAGTRPVPTIAEILAELPALVLP